jgi:hypothetical protein
MAADHLGLWAENIDLAFLMGAKYSCQACHDTQKVKVVELEHKIPLTIVCAEQHPQNTARIACMVSATAKRDSGSGSGPLQTYFAESSLGMAQGRDE